jgi:hypothetical protein
MNNRILFSIYIVFILTSPMSLAQAATYYVYGSGGSDSNDGSAMDAANGWATIQKALNTISEGDTCYVREVPTTRN